MKSNHSTNITRRGALRLLSAVGAQTFATKVALADTSTDLSSAQTKLVDAEAQLGAIATDYEDLSQRQSRTLDELHEVETNIVEITKNIGVIEKRLAEKQKKLSKNVSEEYKDGSHGVVDLLLGSTSIEDFISGMYYYDKVTNEQVQLIQDVSDEHARLESEQQKLTERRNALEEVSRTQEAQLDAMRDKQLEAQELVEGLDKEVRDLLVKRESELLAAQQEAQKAREDRSAAQKQSKVGSSSASSSTDSSGVQKQDKTPRQESASTEATSSTTQSQEPQSQAEDVEESDSKSSSSVQLAEVAPEPEVTTEQELAPEPEDEESTEQVTAEEEPQEDAPQEEESSEGGGSAAAVVAACHSTPSPGGGLCAAWCSNVLMNAGFGFVSGNANDMYAEYCHSSNRDELAPGMAVAVSTHPHTSAGRIYGHIGMYVGDGTVMDNIGYIRTISLDEWISYYGETVPVRWGWLGGIVLS